MSIKVQSYVWEHSKQKHGSLLVLLAIADFADDQGRAFPGVETLGKKARLTERQTQRVLNKLQADGEIEIQPNAGPHGTNLYTVKISGVTKLRGDIKLKKGVTSVTKTDEKMSPEPSLEPSVEPPNKKNKRERVTSVPEDFKHPQAPKAIAEAFTPAEIETETEQFLDHARANGKAFTDWDAAWRTWMRNAIKYRSQRRSNLRSVPNPKTRQADNILSQNYDFVESAFTVQDYMVCFDLTREQAEERYRREQVEPGTAQAA